MSWETTGEIGNKILEEGKKNTIERKEKSGDDITILWKILNSKFYMQMLTHNSKTMQAEAIKTQLIFTSMCVFFSLSFQFFFKFQVYEIFH